MRLGERILRHLIGAHRRVRRYFPPAALKAIECAIREGEQRHGGELRFVIEAHLGLDDLVLRRRQPRERALELFSLLRVWDTADNCGVLVYVLLADRAIEIVADRGIHVRLGAARWREICDEMRQRFAANDYQGGALRGVELVTAELTRHFPKKEGDRNELPDAPLTL